MSKHRDEASLLQLKSQIRKMGHLPRGVGLELIDQLLEEGEELEVLRAAVQRIEALHDESDAGDVMEAILRLQQDVAHFRKEQASAKVSSPRKEAEVP